MQQPCPQCQGLLEIPAELVGQQVKCPYCQQVFVACAPQNTAMPKIPAAVMAGQAPTQALSHQPKCPNCQGLLDIPAELNGQQVKCPYCQQVLVVNNQQVAMVPPAPQLTPTPTPPNGTGINHFAMMNSPLPTAGMGRRIMAFLIDALANFCIAFIVGLIVGIPVGIICGVTQMDKATSEATITAIGHLLHFIVWWCYWVVSRGDTMGKKTMGLHVEYENVPPGQNASIWAGLGRELAKILSSLILLIGYLMAFFNSEHKTLHDILCHTRVVRRS